MKVFYVTNAEPCSYNNTKRRQAFKTNVQAEFNRKYSMLYTGLPIKEKTLKAHVILIHQLLPGVTPDADNLSKPFIDAFCGIIYEDDKQVIRRTADILKLKDFDFMTVDATDMPIEIYDDFENFYLNNEKTILFFEVGEFSSSQIRIGEF